MDFPDQFEDTLTPSTFRLPFQFPNLAGKPHLPLTCPQNWSQLLGMMWGCMLLPQKADIFPFPSCRTDVPTRTRYTGSSKQQLPLTSWVSRPKSLQMFFKLPLLILKCFSKITPHHLQPSKPSSHTLKTIHHYFAFENWSSLDVVRKKARAGETSPVWNTPSSAVLSHKVLGSTSLALILDLIFPLATVFFFNLYGFLLNLIKSIKRDIAHLSFKTKSFKTKK